MPDFATSIQTPEIQALIQENLLTRAFNDALLPRFLFRAGVDVRPVAKNVGETFIDTGKGTLAKRVQPLQPGTDPVPTVSAKEQWEVTIQQLSSSIDTNMPTSAVALADLWMSNIQDLGIQAAESMNAAARDVIYNAGLSGGTFAEATLGATGGTQVINFADATTSYALRVRALNGLTSARRPDVSGASPVRFQAVSSTNPLNITVTTTAGDEVWQITGFTADNSGDVIGPGSINVRRPAGAAARTVNDRAAVLSYDRTNLIRVGGGTTIDSIGANDVLTMAAIRSAASRLQSMNVPRMGDGTFHCHIDPTQQSEVFDDNAWQRLFQSMPDSFQYRDLAIGRVFGITFFENNTCPASYTVDKNASGFYTPEDPIAVELENASAIELHHAVVLGGGSLREYRMDADNFVTEAGTTGVRANFSVTNNGVTLNTDGVQLIMRAPLDRLQQNVSASWLYTGAYVMRTDAATGDNARYKRCVILQSA